MKRNIHVDSYSRSRHGRSSHGGPVSAHNKSVNIVELDKAAALSVSSSMLNASVKSIPEDDYSGIDKYTIKLGDMEDELVLINAATMEEDENVRNKLQLDNEGHFVDENDELSQAMVDYVKQGGTILWYSRWGKQLDLKPIDDVVLWWLQQYPSAKLAVEDSDWQTLYDDGRYIADRGGGVSYEGPEPIIPWLKGAAKARAKAEKEEERPRKVVAVIANRGWEVGPPLHEKGDWCPGWLTSVDKDGKIVDMIGGDVSFAGKTVTKEQSDKALLQQARELAEEHAVPLVVDPKGEEPEGKAFQKWLKKRIGEK